MINEIFNKKAFIKLGLFFGKNLNCLFAGKPKLKVCIPEYIEKTINYLINTLNNIYKFISLVYFDQQ